MVKVYISADIEGITGVTHWDETDLQKEESKAAREQMTAEVAAACEGALSAGAQEVWVKDSHDTGRNIIAARLPREVRLVRGWTGHPFSMVQELNESFSAVVMVGYHSRAGAATNPLAHTMSGQVALLTLNGHPASEFTLHSYVAASLGIPVAFLSGDRGLCDEAALLNSHITTVAVKEGIGEATVNLHPEVAAARIKEGVAAALKGDLSLCRLPVPQRFVMQVRYKQASRAHQMGFYPGARQMDEAMVEYAHENYFEVLRFLLFAT
ncbi:MAG TPA: M55 family metallopeptidase [Anaerolineae bacterium]|nr:M55 family metallopeptidase [Anaerolineae bacterium]